jgi:hypothetical protein
MYTIFNIAGGLAIPQLYTLPTRAPNPRLPIYLLIYISPCLNIFIQLHLTSQHSAFLLAFLLIPHPRIFLL